MFSVEEKEKILLGVKEAFFAAMLAGYAGNGDGSVKTKGPDGKVSIEFIDGDYRVLDEYYTTPHSDCSAGTTIIFYQGDPVWIMFYSGSYPKKVISFLKEVLGRTYAENKFIGGRGPRMICSGNRELMYRNINRSGSFSKFKGREIINDTMKGIYLGFHEYSGMSLL